MSYSLYSSLFLLFVSGSLLGVLLEGVFCKLAYGHWETHVVSLVGPFCIIYGFGAVGYYLGSFALRDKNKIVQFLLFALIGTVLEYLCGCLLKYGLHMKAWDYSSHFLNLNGLVCPQMSALWGAAGVIFCKIAPFLDALFLHIQSRPLNIIVTVLSVFMAADLLFTGVSIVRWKNRHFGIPAVTGFSQKLDERYPDEFMAERFCEWRFIDE